MVMAGAGFDAQMISDADRAAKDRLGRAAYIVSGIKNVAARRVKATVEVHGRAFFKGKVSCVLAANVGKILGEVEAFPQARPDDGRLELGVVTARNPAQWARTFGRLAVGHPDRSPFVKVTQGKKFRIRFDEKVRYELDGGTRSASRAPTIRSTLAPNYRCSSSAVAAAQGASRTGNGGCPPSSASSIGYSINMSGCWSRSLARTGLSSSQTATFATLPAEPGSRIGVTDITLRMA
jgi:hypothetical protein